jgi:prepilin-type N-terminal cleavage/methylation domain-containing protein
MVKGAEVSGVKKGFTLVELLLVVTILGILAAIAVPKLFPQTERARVAEAIAILQSIRQGEQAYFLENNDTYLNCPGPANCWSNLGMEDPDANDTATDPGFFNYSVPNADGAGFTAQAKRTSLSVGNGNYQNTLITIDEAGNYGGNHPFRPT